MVERAGGGDTSDDRLRHIAQLKRSEIKHRTPPDATTLRDALAAGSYISRRELRDITVPRQLAVVSLYLTFAPDSPQPGLPALSVFHSLRHGELERRREFIAQLDRYARMRLERDLEELGAFLDELPLQGFRAIVVFKAGEELNRVVTLPMRVRNRLVVDPDPYTEPLDAILSSHPKALVVIVEKDRAQFGTHHLGHEDTVHEVRSSVPSDDVDRARPGTTQRQRLTHLHWHLRSVARAAADLFSAYDCDVIVLEGDERIVSAFREILPDPLREKVVGEVPHSPGDTRAQQAAKVAEVLDLHRDRIEAEALADLGELQGHGLLVAGLPAVLDAANQFLVRRLAVSVALEVPGYICTDHHYLALEAGSCPFDAKPLVSVENVVDELVEFARQHGMAVDLIDRRQEMLDPFGGVAGELYPAA
jgi:peptide subunit release factor 1 (eRF1)